MRRTTIGQFVILSLIAAPILAQSIAAPATYDRAAEAAIAGTVVGVDGFPAADGTVGVHLEVNTGKQIVRVAVGPAAYIGQNNFSVFIDERVSIIGARISRDGETVVEARTIAKGSAMLVLRNEDGTPRWIPAAGGTDGCGVNHPLLARTTER